MTAKASAPSCVSPRRRHCQILCLPDEVAYGSLTDGQPEPLSEYVAPLSCWDMLRFHREDDHAHEVRPVGNGRANFVRELAADLLYNVVVSGKRILEEDVHRLLCFFYYTGNLGQVPSGSGDI